MAKYIFWRILQMIPILLGITLIVFLLVRVSGDPVLLMLGEEATAEQIEALTKSLGLDRPLYVQYLSYLGDVLQGDLGMSLRYVNQPALEIVMERLPATLTLASTALLIAILISIPAGIIASVNRHGLPDYLASFLSVFGQAIPNFWLGIMLILIFGVTLQWLPVSGWDNPWSVLLPAFTLGASLSAVLTRILRSSLLDVMGQDFIRTAHAKGVSPVHVIFGHALRNAALPYITLIGLEASSLMAGAVVVEQVFAWPGIGLLAVQAIGSRDMAVVQTIVLFAAVIVMSINLIVDVLYSFIDPRIQHG
ncbi:ABC transporter permease [Neptunicoccus cionae]|uniref:ABC transporter permease n=1 Tax=Neptunicoccus cionae TaxID=2035344 RepID=UPI000C7941A5|nr:ABC transporter permease [Amylibacter cionae]PLS21179.1 ABC transporter permease [Amylibacter cionae]